VALDAVFAQIMGVLPGEIMHLQYCQKKKLGIADLEEIEVVGVPISEVRRPFRPASSPAKSLPGFDRSSRKSLHGLYQ